MGTLAAVAAGPPTEDGGACCPISTSDNEGREVLELGSGNEGGMIDFPSSRVVSILPAPPAGSGMCFMGGSRSGVPDSSLSVCPLWVWESVGRPDC